jgi:uncharacterized membrane protein
LLYVLQALHVLFGIAWFGGVVYNDLVILPALGAIDPEPAKAFLASYRPAAERFTAPVAGLTLVLGLVLGFPLGAWADFGHPYGNTFFAAAVAAFAVFAFGVRFITPNAKRLAALTPGGEEFRATAARLRAYSRLELGGFLVLFALMVALRFGY